MLVLTRKIDETIIANYHGMLVEFTILSVDGNRVRIGINAPKSVIVDRKEVHERRQIGEKEFSLPTNPRS